MHLPSVRPIDFLEIYISGDVTIHESAIVAPGTILQAAPDSRIVIGAGVCLGMGTVLKACHGAIAVEEGATLGAGVLLVGQVKIGKNACIGAVTTIFNASVDTMAVIPAGSLIGDTSRQGEDSPQSDRSDGFVTTQKVPQKPLLDPWEEHNNTANGLSASELDEEEQDLPVTETEVEIEVPRPDSKITSISAKQPIVGQMYINQLLVTLFPERNAKIPPKQDSD